MLNRRWIALSLATCATSVGVFFGCAKLTCEDTETCDPGVAPIDEGGPAPGFDGGPPVDTARPDPGLPDAAPPSCDASKDPKDQPACVVDGFAVFVSPTGDDTMPGTKAQPVKTVAKALSLTGKASGKTRVYLCSGEADSYDEAVALTSEQDGVSLYGGFECDWTHKGRKTRLAPAGAAYAFTVFGVPTAIQLQDLEVVAPAGTAERPSSIALFASTSPAVSLKRVRLVALDAFKGADGNGAGAATPSGTFDGTTAAGLAGGGDRACGCRFGNNDAGATVGGRGGAGVDDGGVAAAGVGGSFPLGANGGSVADCAGKAGNGGPGGGNGGGQGATDYATFNGAGWVPRGGANGGPGITGQGGGGGAGVAGADGGGGGGGGGGGR